MFLHSLHIYIYNIIQQLFRYSNLISVVNLTNYDDPFNYNVPGGARVGVEGEAAGRVVTQGNVIQ